MRFKTPWLNHLLLHTGAYRAGDCEGSFSDSAILAALDQARLLTSCAWPVASACDAQHLVAYAARCCDRSELSSAGFFSRVRRLQAMADGMDVVNLCVLHHLMACLQCCSHAPSPAPDASWGLIAPVSPMLSAAFCASAVTPAALVVTGSQSQ